MLSDRRQQILRSLIEEYVSCAMPVGSRTLAEHYHLGVSPATVRNELSALEEDGYITQPHTSAGRVPTDMGYREFVDQLMTSRIGAKNPIERSLADQMRESADRLDELMRRTSEELARLTDCLSIVGSMEEDASGYGALARREPLGLSSLMRKPEFQESSSLLPLMEILENDTVHFEVFDDATSSSDGFAIRIGEENTEAGLSCVSVVAGVYGIGSTQGVVAVIGPKRMDYSKVIDAVRAAQSILDEEGR